MFCFVTLDSTAKYLMQTYPVVQVIWARFFFHLLFVVLLMGPATGYADKKPEPAAPGFAFAFHVLDNRAVFCRNQPVTPDHSCDDHVHVTRHRHHSLHSVAR